MENLPEQDFEVRLAISRAGSMMRLLDERLGADNPYGIFRDELHLLNLQQLRDVAKAMHELLYAPPPRGQG